MKITNKSSEKSREQKMAPWCGWCCFFFITIPLALFLLWVFKEHQILLGDMIALIAGASAIGGICGIFMYFAVKYDWSF